ncbi:probable galactinol--sucrose galactosyltransferase 6 [Setaria italica]|uniref:probable galactinol--sucrose galactosyltransferase 6 n=1 Tax=Setaria italica TaxID=4555 RepID=UPI000BE5B562|nr:probable galactinol--sucrose galactosyltransferase 6 [Setaria italica]
MAHALPSCALTAAIAAVKSALKTFRIRAEKKLPGIVNYFGWCTWDTFYQDVSQEDVEAGLRSLIAAAQLLRQCPGRGPWHAITSYCGSVRPDAAHGRDGALLLKLAVSQGVTGCRGERARDDDRHAHPARARLRSPVYRFYDELHAYLATGSVDGIKVDVQSVLDTLGAGHGGRVQLTKQDHQALDASIAKNFQENLP